TFRLPSEHRVPGPGACACQVADGRPAGADYEARTQMVVLGGPRLVVSSLALALSTVNSPVRISTPSAIITAPPTAMMVGKWRLTIVTAAVIRSKATAISRNGIPRPAEENASNSA